MNYSDTAFAFDPVYLSQLVTIQFFVVELWKLRVKTLVFIFSQFLFALRQSDEKMVGGGGLVSLDLSFCLMFWYGWFIRRTSLWTLWIYSSWLAICSYVSVRSSRCEASEKFGEHERCSSFLSALQTSKVLHISMNAQLTYEPIVL